MVLSIVSLTNRDWFVSRENQCLREGGQGKRGKHFIQPASVYMTGGSHVHLTGWVQQDLSSAQLLITEWSLPLVASSLVCVCVGGGVVFFLSTVHTQYFDSALRFPTVLVPTGRTSTFFYGTKFIFFMNLKVYFVLSQFTSCPVSIQSILNTDENGACLETSLSNTVFQISIIVYSFFSCLNFN